MKPLITIFSTLVLPGVLFAASGACSGHGGVNCAAGPDTDGSVICYDGWQNSSISYSSMVKCAGYSAPAPEIRPVPVVVPVPSTVPLKKLPEKQNIPVKPVIKTVPPAKTDIKKEAVAEVTKEQKNKITEQRQVSKKSFWATVINFLFK